MKQLVYKVLFFLSWALLSSCEEDVAIEIPAGAEQLVVQGHIGQDAAPLVVLTRSVPALALTDAESFTSTFVHDATVTVMQGDQSYILSEKLVRNLSVQDQQLVREQFGFTAQDVSKWKNLNFYVYTSDAVKGSIGQRYNLRIEAEGKLLTATTSIPSPTPIDSLWFIPHPDLENDSLVTLWYRYQDPDTLGNQVRYFTSRNSEPFYPGYAASVFNDEFVNGRTIDFPLERGRPKSAQLNQETDSYFNRGDTVRLKWAAIDYPHYQFWFTLEADRASNGNPLGFPTTVRANITGGLGIWGGYGVSRHRIIAPVK